MHEIDLAQFDLNLLKVFLALIEEGSVTSAGDRLGQAQSTVSHSLARLRESFNDPLFVRSVRGLEPTPLATACANPSPAHSKRFRTLWTSIRPSSLRARRGRLIY